MSDCLRKQIHTRKLWSAYLILLAISELNLNTGSSFTFEISSLRPVDYSSCVAKHFSKKSDDEHFGFTDDKDMDNNSVSSRTDPIVDLDMNKYNLRKQKLMLQTFQQQWHQPPNPLLEDPIEFIQAILMALQQSKNRGMSNGALCLLQSSTPSWRRTLLNSVGAPSNATDDQVAPSLQVAIERPNNQFAILTEKLDNGKIDDNNFSAALSTIKKSWQFPSDPVIFESDDDEEKNNTTLEECEKVVDFCWVESRLRSPEDDQLLVVVGWSLQRRLVEDEQEALNSNNSSCNISKFTPCWFLDGIDWQDFRDEFRPGIGREEWERICG